MASAEKATAPEEIGEICRWLNGSGSDTIRRLGSAAGIVNPGDVDADVERYMQDLGVRSELRQNRGNGILHPLVDRVGKWLRGFQHRRSPFTAT